MSKIRIGVSPVTNVIYAGRLSKDGSMWVGEKHDVTEDAVRSVAEHLLKDNSILTFEAKVKKYCLSVTESVESPTP